MYTHYVEIGTELYKFVNTRTKIIVFIVDMIGFMVWAVCHLFMPWKIVNRKPVPLSPKRILLIRADYIGDVLLTTHTLKGIRDRFPQSHIEYLVSSKSCEILEGNPYIDSILTYDPPWFFRRNGKFFSKGYATEYLKILSTIRKRKFDLSADFRGDVRNIFLLMVLGGIPNRVSFGASGGSYLLTRIACYRRGLHEAEYHTSIAETIGARVDEHALPEMFTEDRDRLSADGFLQENGLDSKSMLVVIHPGARKSVRQWPEERYAEVGWHLIREYGAKIILTGSPYEIPLLKRINDLMNKNALIAAGEIKSLKQLAALFQRCALFIGVSSGPSHIAAVASLPSVLIFGPESISQWKPLGNKCVIIKKRFPCSPCNQKKCHLLENNCVKAVQVSDVIDGIKRIT